jgi:exosome complex component RRP4
MKMRGFGKLEGGLLITVNPNKVPRIIGKEGSMVKLIKGATGCDITVGQNGKVWIDGKDVESELKTKEIVEYIVENATINGLTEKVESFIKDMGLK